MGFDFFIDQIPPIHYPTALPRPWESYKLRVVSSSQPSSGTTLPYITSTLPSSTDNGPMYQNPQTLALPNAGAVTSDDRGAEKKVRQVQSA